MVPSDNASVDTTCQDATVLQQLLSSVYSTVSYSGRLVSITAHSGTFTDCSDRSFKSSPHACCLSDVPTKLFNKGRFSSSPKLANMNENSYFFIYNIQGGFFSFVSSITDHRAGLV